MANVSLVREPLSGPAAQMLIAALNAELAGMYSEHGANHFAIDSEEVAPGRGAFLVAYQGTTPVGCGAVRLLDAATGELKRMYAAPAVRGQGVGRALVDALQAEARRLGAKRLVLETGIRQHAALALYHRCGFRPIPLYGEYLTTPTTSVCLGKELGPPDQDRASTPAT
jgi:GNAT superfamily N-acetyltransferase